MAGGQFRQPNDPNGPTGFGRALSSVKRPNPLVIARRWRYERAAVPDGDSGSDDARPAAFSGFLDGRPGRGFGIG